MDTFLTFFLLLCLHLSAFPPYLSERNKVHRVAAEREILEQLDHPFLPTLYASFQVPISHLFPTILLFSPGLVLVRPILYLPCLKTAKHVCFVTDFCAGGELYDFLEVQPDHRFEEHVAKHYAAEILISLEYLHCQGERANRLYTLAVIYLTIAQTVQFSQG